MLDTCDKLLAGWKSRSSNLTVFYIYFLIYILIKPTPNLKLSSRFLNSFYLDLPQPPARLRIEALHAMVRNSHFFSSDYYFLICSLSLFLVPIYFLGHSDLVHEFECCEEI